MAIKTRVKTDEDAPTQAKFPPVSSLHRTVPVTPSGWVNIRLKMYSGARNIAIIMSETGRFTRRKLIGTLASVEIKVNAKIQLKMTEEEWTTNNENKTTTK